MSQLDTSIELFGEKLSIPRRPSSPVGLTGMYRRRGEVQAPARPTATAFRSPCPACRSAPLKKWRPKSSAPMWFQLYVLKDRGFMQNALERAQAAGCTTLVFTVDMPVPGARYRDAHSGMSGPNARCAATGRP